MSLNSSNKVFFFGAAAVVLGAGAGTEAGADVCTVGAGPNTGCVVAGGLGPNTGAAVGLGPNIGVAVGRGPKTVAWVLLEGPNTDVNG